MIISKKLLNHCVWLALCSFPIFAHANNVAQQREQSIQLIRTGDVETGLSQLESLLKENPQDQKLIADFIVTAYANGKLTADKLNVIQNIQAQNFPEYGRISVIKAYRDQKQYALAEQWVKQFETVQPAAYWNVWRAVLQAEAGQKAQAQQSLTRVNMDQLTADYLSQLAYVYRLLDMPVESLQAAERAVKANAVADTQEQYALALAATSDFNAAQQSLKGVALTDEQQAIRLKHSIQLTEFSQQIKQAIQYQKNNSELGNASYFELDQVIARMHAYAPQLANDAAMFERFQYDYLYALNARNRASQVLTERQKLNKNEADMPAYVRQVLADSYLKTQQPSHAERLYKTLFSDPKMVNYNLFSGLYYSLIEQEKFAEANTLIQRMENELPKYRYSQAKGVDRAPHSDWTEFLTLKGLNYAYRNEHDKAEQYFEKLVAEAPANLSYQNSLALVQRWREKPEQSIQTLAMWNGLTEDQSGIQLNQMQNAQALSDITTWRKDAARLQLMIPDDTGLKRAQKELNDRNHATISHQTSFSKSESDNDAILGRLKGSREQESHTRVSSPWFAENFRGFADHQYRWAKYNSGELDEQRLGLGAEWQKDRKFASAMLSQDLDGGRTGVQLNWSHWLNDHWNYSLGFDSQADIPLQAVRLDHEGKAYQMGLNWQANESRKAGASYQLTDINDGNTRHELGAYFKQRLQAAPHHVTDATVRGYYSQNDQVDVPYFNPKNSHSLELTLEHDWMTWRNYEHSLNQHFEATVGSFGQNGESNKAIYNVFYQHEWQLSRTWRLNYGIGWGVHPYDGEDEEKTYAVVGFEGRF